MAMVDASTVDRPNGHATHPLIDQARLIVGLAQQARGHLEQVIPAPVARELLDKIGQVGKLAKEAEKSLGKFVKPGEEEVSYWWIHDAAKKLLEINSIVERVEQSAITAVSIAKARQSLELIELAKSAINAGLSPQNPAR